MSTITPVTQLGILSVTGPDARSFLHALLTQDVEHLEAGESAPAAWLDARGRVLAFCDLIPTPDGIDLLGARDILEDLPRRLGMYVFRSQVELSFAAPSCEAITGDVDDWLTGAASALRGRPRGSEVSADAGIVRVGPGLAYRYSDDGRPSAPVDATHSPAEVAEIRLGRTLIDTATSGLYTAHMLNLDLLGAVAFDKGCYPGQEIVARTAHRGTAKRRLFGYTTAGESLPRIGESVIGSQGEVGSVVRAALDDELAVLLAVIRTDAADTALELAETGGPLTRLALPHESA